MTFKTHKWDYTCIAGMDLEWMETNGVAWQRPIVLGEMSFLDSIIKVIETCLRTLTSECSLIIGRTWQNSNCQMY